MAKRVSTRRIKKHRLYTYEAAGQATGVTAATARSWRASGLVVIDDQRPHLILGESLIEFHDKGRRKRAAPLAPDQFYCLSCRAPRRPLGLMADYVPMTPARGRLEALCEVCERRCQRFACAASLPALSAIFDLGTDSAWQA
jgi:hypothetical protein